MAHIVAEPCIKCKNTDCAEVCPVNAFREGKNMLVIDPKICIDCRLCVDECPVKAIFPDEELPEEWWEYVEINAKYSRLWPEISQKKEPLPTSEQFAAIKNKKEYFDPEPGP
ncbi:MAG: DUF3470 domain-containing protein [Candidatus Zixiibacteriota bacterium]|jgi:ferredoxin